MTVDPVRPASQQELPITSKLFGLLSAAEEHTAQPRTGTRGDCTACRETEAALFAAIDAYVERRVREALNSAADQCLDIAKYPDTEHAALRCFDRIKSLEAPHV